ncbi:CNP1-like family protein [uncultured Thiocystis sp.]|jgi:hypothetical protein|uniref:CNP1-like family protein n=1 Tax=uncultured Thiocystis sp. TaxID=1202134 RepID=UPI0025F10CDD|nr:CNP1-like family protein [uncultured Thiocystis sp.]
MKHPTVAPICLLLILATPTSAGENNFALDPEPPGPAYLEPGKAWREATTPLPPWPQDADLIEFEPDGPSSAFRYFIDGRHLGVGADQVVRYTLVAESRNGGRNLSYEGIRCTPNGQYKVFAYGSGGQFSPLEGADWQPIAERYRHELWGFHFCVPRGFKPRIKKDMIRSLTGHTASRELSGFQAD